MTTFLTVNGRRYHLHEIVMAVFWHNGGMDVFERCLFGAGAFFCGG
jgi:hypothetical protein